MIRIKSKGIPFWIDNCLDFNQSIMYLSGYSFVNYKNHFSSFRLCGIL